MMAQPSYPPSPTPVCVIGSQFIATCPLEVIIVQNSSGDHLITDVNDKVMFKVKRRNTSHRHQCLLLGADDMPVLTIREKILTAHRGWKAFKGSSKADSEMIFSTKRAKIMQSQTNVHVFLANKIGCKDSCDFKITGSWSNRSCTIYMGESSIIIAQMQKMEPSQNVKGKFVVKIHPYVDYAFVVALMVIVEAMKSPDADNDDDDQVVGDVVEPIGDVVESIGEVVESIGEVGESAGDAGESIGAVADVIGALFS